MCVGFEKFLQIFQFVSFCILRLSLVWQFLSICWKSSVERVQLKAKPAVPSFVYMNNINNINNNTDECAEWKLTLRAWLLPANYAACCPVGCYFALAHHMETFIASLLKWSAATQRKRKRKRKETGFLGSCLAKLFCIWSGNETVPINSPTHFSLYLHQIVTSAIQWKWLVDECCRIPGHNEQSTEWICKN